MTIHKYDTRYGAVFHSTVCKDDFDNMTTSDEFVKPSGTKKRRPRIGAGFVTLQRPALKSFKMAESKLGAEIVLTGSIRSCELQWQLYRSDPNRYAHPNTTLHTQGLAIDVHTDFLDGHVKKNLELCGWKQARPGDEPWHFSFYLKA